MLAGEGKTTVARWNAAWSHPNNASLWQWSTRENAVGHAEIERSAEMVYVVKVEAEGYRPFWGTVPSTRIFEELTS